VKYRKTIDFEARQFPPLTPGWHQQDPLTVEELAQWCGGHALETPDGRPYIAIPTPWGDVRAWPSDWIVPGVQFNFYPVPREDFEQGNLPFPDTRAPADQHPEKEAGQ